VVDKEEVKYAVGAVFEKLKEEVIVDQEKCTLCKKCEELCPVGAISIEDGKVRVDSENCIACYSCAIICPEGAISIKWKYSEPRFSLFKER
jgi:Fe-S-cluster-containing hydrogenase component 2